MIEKLPSQIQWLVAIILPTFKWIHTRAASKLVKNVLPCNLETSLVSMELLLAANHALYEALALGDLTEITMYSLLGVQLLMHLYSCYEIIQLHKKVQTDSSESEELTSAIKEATSNLVISETLEVLIPFIYVLTFVTAYFGPNAGILGNIQNSYWQFKAIDNVATKVYLLFTMVGIDLGVGVISALILWILCKIHMFWEFCHFMKTYWSWMAIKCALLLFQVFYLQ